MASGPLAELDYHLDFYESEVCVKRQIEREGNKFVNLENLLFLYNSS